MTFYIIFAAVIIFALYLIFHDRGEGEGKSRKTTVSRPAVPTAPAARNRNVAERPLSWTYLASLDYDEDIDGDTMETEITGMRYYCSLADLGPVNGIVKPEPENPHDPRAHVVLRADGKKLGYIPRSALEDFEDFNEDDLVCPFAGRVKITRQSYIWADILIALPQSREFVTEELTEYVNSGMAIAKYSGLSE